MSIHKINIREEETVELNYQGHYLRMDGHGNIETDIPLEAITIKERTPYTLVAPRGFSDYSDEELLEALPQATENSLHSTV